MGGTRFVSVRTLGEQGLPHIYQQTQLETGSTWLAKADTSSAWSYWLYRAFGRLCSSISAYVQFIQLDLGRVKLWEHKIFTLEWSIGDAPRRCLFSIPAMSTILAESKVPTRSSEVTMEVLKSCNFTSQCLPVKAQEKQPFLIKAG